VLELLPETNTVVVGDEADLLASGLIAKDVNWLIDTPGEPLACSAKIRYRHAGVPATVRATPDGGAEVRFELPQPAVTPGQAVAFYRGTRVLGGGWIESASKI
jgi:tRNA-specific 2-thiouridylase